MNKSRKNIRLFDKTWELTEEGGSNYFPNFKIKFEGSRKCVGVNQ